jgi:hypothetical protein
MRLKVDDFEFTIKIPQDSFDIKLFKSYIDKELESWKGSQIFTLSKGSITYIGYSAEPDTNPLESGYFEAYIYIDWEHNKNLSLFDKNALKSALPIKFYLAVDGLTEDIYVLYSIEHSYIYKGLDFGTSKSLSRFVHNINN